MRCCWSWLRIMEPNAEVSRALNDAYELFSIYPRPRHLEASPVENADEMLRALTAAPLRQLTGEQIGPYSGSAILTVGDVNDYKHFLPRILEQAVRAPEWMGA